jgi:hypothetical protein
MVCTSTWGVPPPGSPRGAWRVGLRIPPAPAADNIISEAAAVSTRRRQPGSPQSIWSCNGRAAKVPLLGSRDEPPMTLDEGSARLLSTSAANVFDRLTQTPVDQKKNCPTQRANQESS